MPTAAKLVAALSFAFLAWVTGIMVEDTMPGTFRVGQMYPVAIVCGAVMGWFISGAAKRGTLFEAASTGMRTAVIATLAAVFLLALGTMVQVSLRGRYRNPMDAVLDILNKFYDFGGLLMTLPVLVTILLGGAVAGMVTEAAGRRWR
jgi:hypothetical protein